MSSEMIEQVARAMFRNVGFGDCSDAELAQDDTWANHWPKTADHYRALARAAIAAMRDLSGEALTVLEDYTQCAGYGIEGWRAAIDAALTPA